jgi:exopolysaccharide biosynthesis polyprenyl glycosylphosphotransferase
VCLGLCAFIYAFDIDLTELPDRHAAQFVPLVVMAAIAIACVPLLLDRMGLYESQRREALTAIVSRAVGLGAVATFCMSTLALTVGRSEWLRPALLAGLLTTSSIAFFRALALGALRVLRRHGRNYRNVVVVGTGPRAAEFADQVRANPGWGLRILAHIDESEPSTPHRFEVDTRFRKLVDLPELMRSEVIDEVVIALPRSLLPRAEPVVACCATQGTPVTLISDLFGDYLPAPRPVRYGSLGALSFSRTPRTRADQLLKRAIDLVGGGLLLLLTLPVIALSAILVRITSPGPVLFRQLRSGRNGRHFEMLKLRSMVDGAEGLRAEIEALNEMSGPVFKLEDDPRVTPIGRWLRRFSIDELPQCWNVVKGDMSLVGPRPPLPCEVAQYEPAERRRLSVRPGITCLWQVSGRNDISFEDWVKLDLYYIDNWSLALDAKILLRTIKAVLDGRGAS